MLAAAGLVLLTGPAVWAQEGGDGEQEATGWNDVAELSYVATGGNAEAETLSLRNTLSRSWERAVLTVEAAALRAENTITRRFAVGDPGSFRIEETPITELTAERYLLRGRYRQELSATRYWFVGAGWERNQFAGVDSRLVALGGVGNTWFEGDEAHFRTDVGLTFTEEEDLDGQSTSFAGLRLGWDYRRELTGTTTYTNLLTVDANADETSDYRADLEQSLAVSVSERLALKVSLQVLYDNQPSLVAVPLQTPAGVPTGTSVRVPLDELDTVFNVALVVDF